MNHHQLHHFTRPSAIRDLNRSTLTRFLHNNSAHLTPAATELLQNPTSDFEEFCSAWARQFKNSAAFGAPLREALSDIETLAAPEHEALLQQAIQSIPEDRQLPYGHSPLHQSLHLWLLSQSVPGVTFPIPNNARWKMLDAHCSMILPAEPPAAPSAAPDPALQLSTTLIPPISNDPLPTASTESEYSDESKIKNQKSKIPQLSTTPALPNGECQMLDPQCSISPPIVLAMAPSASVVKSRLENRNPKIFPGALLLSALRDYLRRFVVLPKHAAETLALWILHTHAFNLRDVSTYVGIESPAKRCGKTTLLSVLAQLVHQPVIASNISPSAFFRVIEQLQPTLLIDEADTVLFKNDELRGILNAGYKRDTAYVLRVANEPCPNNPESKIENRNSEIRQPSTFNLQPSTASSLRSFSTWCPKAIAAIGHLPETLADRCILIRMHRKSGNEDCERLRNLDGSQLRQQCADFVRQRASAITAAQPEIPQQLNDRAADIWEPLLILADLAGGEWPAFAREAAVALAVTAPENNPVSSLFLDLFVLFTLRGVDRLATRDILQHLMSNSGHPWSQLRHGKAPTERWLSDQLRDYGIRPHLLRIGDTVARGYLLDDLRPAFKSYISAPEFNAWKLEMESALTPAAAPNPAR